MSTNTAKGHPRSTTDQPNPPDQENQVREDPAASGVATLPEQSNQAVSTGVDYGEDSGAGLEGLDTSEMLVPFVRILQALSPVCVEGSPAYDPDMRPGMIIHTATGEAYPKDLGIGFVPCFRDSSYTEWVPIQPGQGTAGGGGFRGTWQHDDPRILQMLKEQGAFKKLKTTDGTELVETRTLYGLIIPRAADGSWITELATNGVISFSSTQLKKYKIIITRLQALVQSKKRLLKNSDGSSRSVFPPMWSWRWNLGTQPEKNKFGSYYGWRLTLAEDTANASMMEPSDELYGMAAGLYHLVKAGSVKADFAASGGASDHVAAGGGGGETGAGGDIDEQIPF